MAAPSNQPKGATVDRESLNRWEIEQDEVGRPRIRHRHPMGTISAYVSRDADGAWKASGPARTRHRRS